MADILIPKKREELTTLQQDIADKILEQIRARARVKLESRSDYQTLARMTAHQRAMKAIEDMALDMIRLNNLNGHDLAWEDARRTIEGYAYRSDAQVRTKR